MKGECKICGVNIENSPQMNEMCIDCFSDEWRDIVEISPTVGPELLQENANDRRKEEKG